MSDPGTNNPYQEHQDSTEFPEPILTEVVAHPIPSSNKRPPATINTDNLSSGMVVKNYKILCELLGQKPTTSTSKKAQLKEWQRYFEWENDGQKFIITDVYDVPLSKSAHGNSTYVHLIETLLVAFLSRQKDFYFTTTETELYQILKMVNPRYSDLHRENTYEKMTDKDEDNFIAPISYCDFCSTVHKRLRDVLHNALKSMSHRRLLEYRSETVYYIGTEEHLAETKEERKEILSAQREALVKMGFDSVFQVIIKNKIRKYYDNVNEILNKRLGWTKTYQRLVLVYTPEHLTNAIDTTKNNLLRVASREDIVINEQKLNEAITLMLENETQRKIENWRKKRDEYIQTHAGWGEVRLPKDLKKGEFLDNPQYIRDQQFLIDYFIKVD